MRDGHLIRPLTLRGLGILLALILIGLFPARHFLQLGASPETAYERMAILYHQALLRVSPDNVGLRLALTRQLMEIGELAAARETLAPLGGNHDIDIQWLLLELNWQAYAALPAEAPERARHLERLTRQLATLESRDDLPPPHLAKIAHHWLAIGHPARAAQCYEQLAERDSPKGYHWLTQAGYWWLKAGAPERSARAWHRAWQIAGDAPHDLGWLGWVIPAAHAQQDSLGSEDPPRREAALAALSAAEQSQSDIGVAYAREYLSHYPDDETLLTLGIRLALAHDEPEQAFEWSQHYLDLHPDDVDALERHVSIALGLDRLESAIQGLERLQRLEPNQLDHLERLAHTQQWADQHRQALDTLERLARASERAEHDREVVTLALSLRYRTTALAALRRLNERGELTPDERHLLVDLLDALGEPDAAIAQIRRWEAAGDGDRELRIRLATWLEQVGRLEDAQDAWARLAGHSGLEVEATRERSRLLTQQWRLDEALTVLGRIDPDSTSAMADEYWRQRAELAWQVGDARSSRQAYQALFARHSLENDEATRLIRTAGDGGDLSLAMRVTRERWEAERDTDAIMEMLDLAQRESRPDLTRALLAMVEQDPAPLADSPHYWGALGAQRLRERDAPGAVSAYREALALAPGEPYLRAGMLYALAADGEHEMLRQRLGEWAAAARGHTDLMAAMANGHRQLGELDRALRWYRSAAQAAPRDTWLQLDHADTLALTGHAAAAFRLRHQALADLLPQLAANPNASTQPGRDSREDRVRALGTLTTLAGPDSGRGWYHTLLLQAFDDTPPTVEDSDWLFDANLALNRPLHARYLLLRTRDLGHRSPDWQRLSVALEKNDRATLKRLLDDDTAALSAADRFAALQRLDRRQEALALATDLTAAGHDQRADAVALANELPHRLVTRASHEELGDLSIDGGQLSYERAGERWWGRLDLAKRRLDTGHLDLDADGLEQESVAGLTLGWNGARSDTRLQLGGVESDDDTRVQLRLDQRWQATSRLAGGVYGALGQTSEIGDLMRVLGVEDRVGANLEWQPTARDVLSFDASHLIFRSREEHERLGDGMRLEADWSHALVAGASRRLELRLMASHERHDPVDQLPEDTAARLPAGSTPDQLLDDSNTFVGVGIGIARGEPGHAYPRVASPRLRFDLDAGYHMPNDEFAINTTFAVGSRLLGNDELGLRLTLDQGTEQGASNSDDTRFAIALTYQYFLGRQKAARH
ncbi:tetratricopeptide repeat protein [Halomonas sp. SL1]|uniref:tetratricopeptide repeat protein n=1 Tax=Halomonas sp. SL1 TaxID=2137478 RepID=UPI000D15EFD7|nr:tetratricopeptide repeat protein [Halomonas sp. SL1]RAH39450.1 hypothetical protein C9J49_000310 [Halomonas sp. SL1]